MANPLLTDACMYNGSVKVHVHVVSSFCSCLLVMTRFTKNQGIRMECGEEFNGIRNQLLPNLVPSESSYLYVRPGFTVYYRACSFVELMTKNLSAKIDLLGYRWVRDQVAFCSVTLITHTINTNSGRTPPVKWAILHRKESCRVLGQFFSIIVKCASRDFWNLWPNQKKRKIVSGHTYWGIFISSLIFSPLKFLSCTRF